MKKPLLVALIAATALVPIAATAQEWQGRRGNRGSPEAQQPAGERPSFDREAFRAQRDAMRAQRQQDPAAQAQRDAWRAQRQPGSPDAGRPAFDRDAWRAQREAQRTQQGAVQQQRPAFDRDAWRAQRDAQRAQQGGGFANAPGSRDAVRDRVDAQQDRRGDWRDRNDGRRDDRQVRRDDRRGDWQDRRDDRQGDWRDRRNDRPGWNGNSGWNGGRDGLRGDNRWQGQRWNRGWRSDNRYDWRRWRTSNRSIYRLPRYYAPPGYGYGYQRFGIGVTLGSILYARNYWIDDPWQYRLPEVYGPYRWVRYYNDAMLVDVYTGEVVDVIYDIFW